MYIDILQNLADNIVSRKWQIMPALVYSFICSWLAVNAVSGQFISLNFTMLVSFYCCVCGVPYLVGIIWYTSKLKLSAQCSCCPGSTYHATSWLWASKWLVIIAHCSPTPAVTLETHQWAPGHASETINK